MIRTSLSLPLAALLIVGVAAPAIARDVTTKAAQAAPFAQFTPQPDGRKTRLDFSFWNTALHWFVLRMGTSLRQYESLPDAALGSRFVYGHDSPYRLEGNRVAFSMMPRDVVQSLTDYRHDLEALPDSVPLTRLARNEQLAYWINLHNVAMIEQLALAYPVASPAAVRPGNSDLPLDEAPFITVSGVKLSPKDIRTRIVYPNWSDPKVIYGFWHGDIGGPSIDRNAFTAAMIDEQLSWLAKEFVNSLRGTQRRGSRLLVSELYAEARPFYFRDWQPQLRAHLVRYSDPEVAKLIAATSNVDPRLAERDIADLSKGESDPQLNTVLSNGEYASNLVNPAVARLLTERQAKLEEISRRRGREGQVTVMNGEEPAEEPKTVE